LLEIENEFELKPKEGIVTENENGGDMKME